MVYLVVVGNGNVLAKFTTFIGNQKKNINYRFVSSNDNKKINWNWTANKYLNTAIHCTGCDIVVVIVVDYCDGDGPSPMVILLLLFADGWHGNCQKMKADEEKITQVLEKKQTKQHRKGKRSRHFQCQKEILFPWTMNKYVSTRTNKELSINFKNLDFKNGIPFSILLISSGRRRLMLVYCDMNSRHASKYFRWSWTIAS